MNRVDRVNALEISFELLHIDPTLSSTFKKYQAEVIKL